VSAQYRLTKWGEKKCAGSVQFGEKCAGLVFFSFYEMFEGATLHNKAWTCPSGPRSCYAPAFATDYSLVKALEQCFTESSDGDCSCSTTACGSAAQHISKWNTSGIALMNDLFKDKMEQMFRYAYSFNYDISSWTGTAATTAQVGMFEVATAFQDKFLCTDANKGPASSCVLRQS